MFIVNILETEVDICCLKRPENTIGGMATTECWTQGIYSSQPVSTENDSTYNCDPSRSTNFGNSVQLRWVYMKFR